MIDNIIKNIKRLNKEDLVKQLAEIADEVDYWDGDTIPEKVANAVCDIHTLTACSRCGKGVRPSYRSRDGYCMSCMDELMLQKERK